MRLTIRFRGDTVKALSQKLQAAFQKGDGRVVRRITALLWLSDGLAVREVCERVGVSRETVYGWVRAFVLEGMDSLKYRTSPGRPSKLTKTQKQRLKELVTQGPQAAGYATGCWNSALVQELILREFGKHYSVHYLSQLLRNLGLSYQKARFVSDHLDEQARQRWLSQVWPQLLEQARQRDALLLFADEASFAQWGSLGYTWAPKGEQPLVLTTGKRKSYKVWGLMEYFSGQLYYQGSTERLNAKRYCEFLAWVLAQTQGPIIIVQDGARYHTAAQTRQFVAEHSERLSVYQLPSYSPDYNPIEHLWRNVKRHKTHNRYFPSFDSLTAAVEERLSYLVSQPQQVKALMGTCLDQMAETTAETTLAA